MKKVILSAKAHGYDAAGNQVSTRDWSQNFVTVRRVTFENAIDLDGEVFDLDEMDESGLYNAESDKVIIPKNTQLHFNGYTNVGGHKYAEYRLPEYNNVEISINFDYWNLEFSKQVKVLN